MLISDRRTNLNNPAPRFDNKWKPTPVRASGVFEGPAQNVEAPSRPQRFAPGNRKLCPSCFRRNRAWVLRVRCPFCGTPVRPIPDVVGPAWPAALAEMLRVTETTLGAKP